MRRLGQPRVLKSAAIAALLTAVLCFPRLWLWPNRSAPIWYLEATLFLGVMVLWGFVFAWHSHYTQRPVFTLDLKPIDFATATIAAVAVAVMLAVFVDPVLRARTPDDYPANFIEWLARVLFELAFLQLLLTFAPFAWLVRLLRNRNAAIILTVCFDVAVLILKIRSSAAPPPASLFTTLVLFRILIGGLSVLFYLRGGVLLAWWWAIVPELRHLFAL